MDRRDRVILVDDEAALLEALRQALERGDCEVVATRRFDEARHLLLTEEFDVLITDVRLGAFNGIQLAVIGRDRSPEMKIIVFSGYDDPVLRAQATDLGATYLVKPVTGERLIEELGKLAEARGGEPRKL